MQTETVFIARYEDEIMVITRLKHISPARLCFSYDVLNTANHELLATGETLHAWTDKALKPVNAIKTVPDVYSILSKAVI
ncbi:MAG: hypothetical protein ABFD25_10045 [Clostridiaceae bacterium]